MPNKLQGKTGGVKVWKGRRKRNAFYLDCVYFNFKKVLINCVYGKTLAELEDTIVGVKV